MPIQCGLKVKEPMRPVGYIFGNPDCIVRDDINCDRTGVVYRIACETCISTSQDPRNVYNHIGLTCSSLHSRMLDHLKGQRGNKNTSPLYRHGRDCHEGEPQKYLTTIEASEKKILKLHCNEALRIERQNPALRINERQEGGRGGIVRIATSRFSY